MAINDLNCEAEWTWEVRTREGLAVAAPETNAWSLEGDRRLDDTGQVELIVQTGCCDSFDSIETGDELYLFRRGELAYYGPVTADVTQSPFGEGKLESRDRSWWLTGRFFAFPVDWTDRDVGLSLYDLLAASEAVDPLTALRWSNAPAGNLLGEVLSLIPTDVATFYLVLSSMANSVIDYTVLGDEMLVGLRGTGVPALPVLTTDSWDDGRFTRSRSHEDYADQIIVGGKDDIKGFFPPFVNTPPFRPAPNPRWGSRVLYLTDSQLADVASCEKRAQAEYELRNPPPQRVSVPDGRLRDSNVSFNQLIPGAQATIAVPDTCGDVQLIDMLLATVYWTVDGGQETLVRASFVEEGVRLAFS